MPTIPGVIPKSSTVVQAIPGVTTLRVNDGSSSYTGIKSAATGLGSDLVLPNTLGSSGQAIVGDGAGNLSFATVGATATQNALIILSGS